MTPEINDLGALTGPQRDALLAQLLAPSPPPAPLITRPKRRKKNNSVQYLTSDELAALFRAIAAGKNPMHLAIFELAYHRGLRASEVGLLQLSQLRLEQRRLRVQRLKGGNSAEYVLTERELKALRSYLRIRGNEDGPLFLSRQHRPIGRRRLDQLMRLYATAAGLPPEKSHFHCLRHSCATSLLEQEGVGIEDVQDHLGHVDIRNTMIYAKITNQRRTKTGERLRRSW